MKTHHRTASHGFTLVEMLITVTVIGIIAAMAFGALMNAQEGAREQRTRALIGKLHTQLMYRWESYQTRRLPMVPQMQGESRQQFIDRRTWAQRDLMRFELPQRYLDIVDNMNDFPVNGVSSTLYRYFDNVDRPLLTETPALTESYLRRYNNNKIAGVLSKPSDENEAAECLYMVVTMGHDDSMGGQRFRAADVADTDNDGMPEFIDGWGRPINFLRWAPGFLPASALSPAQLNQAAITDLHTGDPENDHDPFDPLRVTVPTATEPYRGMRLMPLIYSAGADGINDIWSKNAVTGFPLSDPYYQPTSDGLLVGTPMTPDNSSFYSSPGEGRHMDNITNHALGVR